MLWGGDLPHLPLHLQCDAIRWEQFVRACRLEQLHYDIQGKDSILDQKYKKQIFRDLYYEDLNFKSD